jgi:hypothetical protein
VTWTAIARAGAHKLMLNLKPESTEGYVARKMQELKAKIVDLKKKNNDLEFQMQQILINNKIQLKNKEKMLIK